MAFDYDPDVFDTDFLDDDDDVESLLGLDADDDLDDAVIPKSRVQALVRKRLEKAQRSADRKMEEFKAVYGVTPDEAVALATAKANGMGVTTPPIQTQVPPRPVQSLAWNPNEALSQSGIPNTGARDPRIDAVEQRVNEILQGKQLEAEAMEFSRKYPGVTFEQIPVEVRNRREAGGVTLVEAMDMYVGNTVDARTADARRQGAEGALRNVQRNRGMFSEGSDLAGTKTPGEVAFINPDDKEFINDILGMSDKQFIKAQQRAKQYKQRYGLGE